MSYQSAFQLITDRSSLVLEIELLSYGIPWEIASLILEMKVTRIGLVALDSLLTL